MPLAGRGMRFAKVGLPMLLLAVGGSYALREVMSLRVAMRDEKTHKLCDEEIKALNAHQGPPVAIEEEIKRLHEKVPLSDDLGKRVPRPGERQR